MAHISPYALELPVSSVTVGVSIINSAHIQQPPSVIIQDQIPGFDVLDAAVYSFLIEHESGSKVLFDLGMRKDFENLAPAMWNPIKQYIDTGLVSFEVERDVATILQDEGFALSEIEDIILSHWHFDHLGNPETFPNTTSLVFGPGFQDALLPGYPANPGGVLLESDYQGHKIRELDFENDQNALQIGRFQAVDYFGDGSFYLLNAPGHTFGHIAALARTTPTTFMLLGGDTCHHAGAVRPNKYTPLPEEISPSPFSVPPFRPGSTCPGEAIAAISPYKSGDQPFIQNFTLDYDRDISLIKESIAKTSELDALDNVFVVIAHDTSLLDVVDFFPKKANKWKEKGWKEAGKWKFLAEFSLMQNYSACDTCK